MQVHLILHKKKLYLSVIWIVSSQFIFLFLLSPIIIFFIIIISSGLDLWRRPVRVLTSLFRIEACAVLMFSFNFIISISLWFNFFSDIEDCLLHKIYYRFQYYIFLYQCVYTYYTWWLCFTNYCCIVILVCFYCYSYCFPNSSLLIPFFAIEVVRIVIVFTSPTITGQLTV